MVKIISLRAARKSQNRAKKRAQGNENAAKFGQSKALKKRSATQRKRQEQLLDGAKLSD